MRHEVEPILDAQVSLSDGRSLAYAVWGDPDGQTVLLFHGAPGSRMFTPDPDLTARAGVRLVTVDRPGYGRSDADPGRTILDWPADILQLADAIQAPRFAIAAHSSGGPYALACAVQLSNRISAVTLVSCPAPYDVPMTQVADDEDRALTRLCRDDPDRAVARFAESIAVVVDDPEVFLTVPRPPPDSELLADEGIRNMFLRTIHEAVRQGADAYGRDCVLERRPWGFALGDVDQNVSIWHGEQDGVVDPAQAAALKDELHVAHLSLVPDDGHGLILARWTDILDDLRARLHGRG